jgi:hypothetical protein
MGVHVGPKDLIPLGRLEVPGAWSIRHLEVRSNVAQVSFREALRRRWLKPIIHLLTPGLVDLPKRGH